MNICIIAFSHRYNTQETCNEALRKEPLSLMYVPNWFKTLEMSERAVEDKAEALEYVPDRVKDRNMCERAV